MKTKQKIDWMPFDDGWGIIGYSFECPRCQKTNLIARYWNDEVECEYCFAVFKNPKKPE